MPNWVTACTIPPYLVKDGATYSTATFPALAQLLGSTYGGNPFAMAVATEAFAELSSPELLAHVRDVAGYFTQQLEGLKSRFPDIIVDIRGRGLLIGVKLIPNNRSFMGWARDERLLIAGGGDNCVRLLPPLIITQEEAREAIEKFERACVRARADLAGAKAS